MSAEADAARTAGLELFYTGDYGPAAAHLRRVVDITNAPDDWFNLCTAATMAGDVSAGASALERALARLGEAGATTGLGMPKMRFYFAQALVHQGAWDRALEQILALRPIYERLKITDDTFLYLRGVPLLAHTIELALKVFAALGPRFAARAWLLDFASRVDDEGAAYLREATSRNAVR